MRRCARYAGATLAAVGLVCLPVAGAPSWASTVALLAGVALWWGSMVRPRVGA